MIFRSSIARRRLENFNANRRAVWSLWIFIITFIICLFAEFVANDKPLLISFKGELYTPALNFYPETTFGGDFETEPEYSDPVVKCLIRTGGLEDCFDTPEDVMTALNEGSFNTSTDGYHKGWLLLAPIPYSFNTINLS